MFGMLCPMSAFDTLLMTNLGSGARMAMPAWYLISVSLLSETPENCQPPTLSDTTSPTRFEQWCAHTLKPAVLS